MPRRRTILLTMLALLVPLPAFALTEDGGPAGPVEIAVSASLGGCGLAETQIVCQIDASWSAVEDADYYTLSVTRADGSVVDYGQSAGTGTSMWVPYVGSGTYSVEVVAWGTPAEEAKAQVIARDRATSQTETARPAMTDADEAAPGERGHQAAGPGTVPVTGEPAGEDPDAAPEPELVCEEPTPEPAPEPVEPPDEVAEDAGAATGEVAPETEEVSATTQADLEAEAELPDSVSCP